MPIDHKDYYAALGIQKDASAAQIKQAYRRLAKQHHPDLHPEMNKARAGDRFKEINEAYEVLSDPKKKAKFDGIGPDWGAGREPHAGTGDASFEGFSDFFGTLFGNGGARGFRRDAGGRQDSGKGQDVEAELPLSLEDSLRGGDKRISIAQPVLCPACAGTGRSGNHFCPTCAGVGETRRERSVTAHLPKWTREGMRVRLRGQGSPSARGGAPGDLFLRIRLLPHPTYAVTGSDLETEVSAMPWDAYLGGEIAVPTLDGPIRIRIPAGTHSGRRLRVAGRGLPNKDASRGDLYAVVRIDNPKAGIERMAKLFQDLREANP